MPILTQLFLVAESVVDSAVLVAWLALSVLLRSSTVGEARVVDGSAGEGREHGGGVRVSSGSPPLCLTKTPFHLPRSHLQPRSHTHPRSHTYSPVHPLF
jgi:hypothetical protein